MAVRKRAQVGLEDTWVRDAELEQLLEDREEKKKGFVEYNDADKKARGRIATIVTPMPYRCGRFVISETIVEPKTVQFDTDGSKRLNIKLAEA